MSSIPQLLFRKSNHGDVWQDKIANTRDRKASQQPASRQEKPRSAQLGKTAPRTQTASTPTEGTVPLTLHVPPIVKDRIKTIAKQEALRNPDDSPSLSEIGRRYLERGLQSHMDMQYGALLEPMIKKIMNKNQQHLISLFRWLLMRIALDGHQTRTLVTNIFVRQEHIPKKARETILTKTAETAKQNIFGKSQQIMELVAEFDEQFATELSIN